MVDADHADFDYLVGHLVAAAAVGLDDVLARRGVLEKMTREAYICVDAEVFFALEGAVARGAIDPDAVYCPIDMAGMAELCAAELQRFVYELGHIMTARSQT